MTYVLCGYEVQMNMHFYSILSESPSLILLYNVGWESVKIIDVDNRDHALRTISRDEIKRVLSAS